MTTPSGPPPTQPPTTERRDRPPRSAPRIGNDGRRLSTAGHALVVCALALVFAALLTAPGMHKSAFNRQPGTQRDVALALTAPLADVSHALLLDRPRHLLQSAIGRGSADEIDTAIELPPATTGTTATTPGTTTAPATTTTGGTTTVPAPTTPPPARPKLAFTPKRKLRLWVAGDSLVITPGYSIVRAAGASPVIQSVGGVDGHVATGLTRPDVFNWFTHIAAEMKKLRPKVVVLNFGANDDHGYMTGLPPGASIGSFASPAWSAEYRRRVAGVMDTVNRAGGGRRLDRPADHAQRGADAAVRHDQRDRPEGSKGPTGQGDLHRHLHDVRGRRRRIRRVPGERQGRTVKVRAGDGVHFDTAGGDMIARRCPEAAERAVRPHELAETEAGVTRLRGVASRRQRRRARTTPDGRAARGLDGARARATSRRCCRAATSSSAPEARSAPRRRCVAAAIEDAFGLQIGVVDPLGGASSQSSPSQNPFLDGAQRPRSHDAPCRVPVGTPGRRRGCEARARPLAAGRIRRQRARGVPQLPERIRPLAADARLSRAEARDVTERRATGARCSASQTRSPAADTGRLRRIGAASAQTAPW